MKKNTKNFLKFMILSLIGILLFMFPFVQTNGGESKYTILVAIFVENTLNYSKDYLSHLLFIVCGISFLGTFVAKFHKFKSSFIRQLFEVNMMWFVIRMIGFCFVVIVYFKLPIEMILNDDNGGFIFSNLLTTLFVLFAFAGMFLSLLLNYGLLEFVGVLMTKIMRPFFKLPGRSAVDCVTSWLGDGTLGVMLTSKQYEDGHYSEKEAAVIATAFSAVSITFCLVVLKQVNLGHLFIPYYITICVVGIVCAIIIPRIPPLSKKSNLSISKKEMKEEVIVNHLLKHALNKALVKAESEKGFMHFLKNGVKTVIEMWVSVLLVVMAVGTIALVVSNTTNFFEILGKPIVPILNLLQIPEATAASKTIFVGFADMFIPSIIAGNEIQSELTRFIVATVSVTQLIYMSEVGSLIIGSKIPVSFKELLLIFLQRTIISLVVVTFIGKFILHLV